MVLPSRDWTTSDAISPLAGRPVMPSFDCRSGFSRDLQTRRRASQKLAAEAAPTGGRAAVSTPCAS